MQWKRVAVVGLLAIAVASAFVADVATGSSNLPLAEVIRALVTPEAMEPGVRTIVWQVRLPYALMALLIGGSLALAGAEMQTVLDNPLASPFTLGVQSAASFGAALAIVLGVGVPGVSEAWLVSANAFVFAFLSVMLLQAAARLRGSGAETLVLLGIAMAFTFNALVALMQFVATQAALQQVVFWTMGSLARASWEKLAILAGVLAFVLPFSLAASWRLTALRLGEERARSLGVNVARLRFVSLSRVSLLAATSVAFAGVIGFVGLVGPHMARLMVGEDHRLFLPASVLTGALVMSLASIASKTIAPGTLIPVGIVTALIGVPFFVALIFGSRERPR
jgi:iron complex transport system permease protein